MSDDKQLIEKCQQELLKMLQRLIDKKSELVDKCEIINGELYARCKLPHYGNVILCDDELEKKIKAKIRLIGEKKVRLRMTLDEAKQMTLINLTTKKETSPVTDKLVSQLDEFCKSNDSVKSHEIVHNVFYIKFKKKDYWEKFLPIIRKKCNQLSQNEKGVNVYFVGDEFAYDIVDIREEV